MFKDLIRTMRGAPPRSTARPAPRPVVQPPKPAAADPADEAHWQAERAYWTAQLRDWMQSKYDLALHPLQDDDATVPAGDLVSQIQGGAKSRPDTYFATGCRTALELLRELDDYGFDPRKFRRILEFGVGTGRLLRHFLPFACERHGCDVTPDVLTFAKRVLGTAAHLAVNDLSPPLAYRDAAFDFVYANSVFTHIQHDATAGWIAEMARVVRPRGACIVTVFEPNHYLRQFAPREIDSMARGPGYLEWGTSDVAQRFMYMTPARLAAAWSGPFELLELRSHFREQSHLILRRR